MKTVSLIIFTLILSFNSVKGQEHSFLVGKVFSWEAWESKLANEDKKLRISKIEDVDFIELIEYKRNFIDQNISNFHFVDFNSDGNLDIIYYGFAGSESNRTLLFRYSKEKYYKELDCYGEIIKMWKPSQVDPISFVILEYPCCDENTYHMETYVPILEDGELKYRFSAKSTFLENTQFPDSTDLFNIPFKIKNDRYVLRSSPKIDIDADNIVAEYSSGATGYALSESVDDTGRVWWFVVMDNFQGPIRSKFEPGNNAPNIKPKYMGWMSSRFLEEL